MNIRLFYPYYLPISIPNPFCLQTEYPILYYIINQVILYKKLSTISIWSFSYIFETRTSKSCQSSPEQIRVGFWQRRCTNCEDFGLRILLKVFLEFIILGRIGYVAKENSALLLEKTFKNLRWFSTRSCRWVIEPHILLSCNQIGWQVSNTTYTSRLRVANIFILSPSRDERCREEFA